MHASVVVLYFLSSSSPERREGSHRREIGKGNRVAGTRNHGSVIGRRGNGRRLLERRAVAAARGFLQVCFAARAASVHRQSRCRGDCSFASHIQKQRRLQAERERMAKLSRWKAIGEEEAEDGIYSPPPLPRVIVSPNCATLVVEENDDKTQLQMEREMVHHREMERMTCSLLSNRNSKRSGGSSDERRG